MKNRKIESKSIPQEEQKVDGRKTKIYLGEKKPSLNLSLKTIKIYKNTIFLCKKCRFLSSSLCVEITYFIKFSNIKYLHVTQAVSI